MADEVLLNKVHGLGDLELAMLLSLIGREHCLLSCSPRLLSEVVEELQAVRHSIALFDIVSDLEATDLGENIRSFMRSCELYCSHYP
jgi:hypothetical protein